MYLDVQGAGIRNAHELQESVEEYLNWVRTSTQPSRIYLFLDEVTGVDSWGTAIRVLHGRGQLQSVTVLATGSHARDVKRGGETMPGRRGDVDYPDWIMLPLSFRDYLQLLAPSALSHMSGLDVHDPRSALEAAQEIELRQSVVRPLFDRYLLSGGYPYAIQAEQSQQKIPASAYQVYRDAIVGEMRRAGHREELFREVALWFAYHLPGREFSWRDVSGETEIGSKDTAREIIENGEAAFIWHVYYRVRRLGTPQQAPRSPKKLYPADSLSWHALRSWALGISDPWADAVAQLADPTVLGHLVEAAVADHLRRAFGRFAFYYRTTRGEEEIDFVT